MPTTSTRCAATAARDATRPSPAPRRAGALRRWAAAAIVAACAGLCRPAVADDPAHAQAAPARGAGTLLLLSFLVPLPLPAALVAPPAATRSPAMPAHPDACAGPQRQACLAARRADRR